MSDLGLGVILNCVKAEIGIGGKWLDATAAARAGLVISGTVWREGKFELRTLTVLNQSGQSVSLDGFRWRMGASDGGFFASDGKAMRVYLEGWTMASPCGVRKYGEYDFQFNPEYLPFAVCRPDRYCKDTPNRFRSEHLTVVRDGSGKMLLAGFVTSARAFGNFTMRLAEEGMSEFDAYCDFDGRTLSDGETVTSETLAFSVGTESEVLLEEFAEKWGECSHRRNRFETAAGWCSWYYYFDKVREEDILSNVKFLAQNREKYPVRYLQLDDGYQSFLGDWLTCNEKFPHGLAYLAGEIRKAGFVPALWLGPFMAEEGSRLLAEHPEWMLHDKAGNVLYPQQWREGRKAAVLDGTNPAVQRHFEELFRAVRSLGFDYVKLDFMMLASATPGAVRFDPNATRAEALRRGMEAIRRGFGEDGFILGCTVPLGQMVAVVDAERISTDITPYWEPPRKWYDEAPTVPNVCRNVAAHIYMHKRLWLNDPDTLIVRSDNTELTENEVHLWADLLTLSGGMILSSDNLPSLTPDRAVLAEDLLNHIDRYETRVADRFEHVPCTILEGVERSSGKRVTGLFHYGEGEAIVAGTKLAAHSSKIIEA
ncbi:MAG: alpha-galactosidase [Victivallaceae bacterium]|nr:alpha-galactosidase [Victivallaceae bacterium]